MRTLVVVLLVALSTACTVERFVPKDDFSCKVVGACSFDASPRPDVGPKDGDAGTIDKADAGPGADVPLLDAGEHPLPMCPGLEPLAANGVALGDTTASNNGYEGGCFPPGGKDAVFGFTVPGRLAFLEVSTAGSAFDTALHVYRDDCDAASRIACNDETEYVNTYLPTSEVRLYDVEPGSYAAIVDAFLPAESGSFVLRVSGAVAPGEICDPGLAFLPCQIGTCAPDGTGFMRCPEVLDCPDGIDADRDGMMDEDVCTSPPSVTCNPGQTTLLDRPANPSAAVNDNGTIIYRQWTAESVPRGTYAEPRPRDQEGTEVLLDIDGPYRLRYVAADDDLQLSACEVTLNPIDTAILRVELYWSPDAPRWASTESLILHLLHPTGTAWFDPQDDCAGALCFDMPLDWDTQGDLSDDPLWVGFFYGPQRIYVDSPRLQGRYAVGVHLIDLGGRAAVDTYVRIYCGGVLKQEFGPVNLTNGSFMNQDQNDFWKVAEMDFDAGGDCQVFPIGGGTPVVVRAVDAQSAR